MHERRALEIGYRLPAERALVVLLVVLVGGFTLTSQASEPPADPCSAERRGTLTVEDRARCEDRDLDRSSRDRAGERGAAEGPPPVETPPPEESETPVSAPLVLVTLAEIQALPSDVPVSATKQGDQNGPIIQIDSPENLGKYSGPFPIKVEFLVGPEGLPVDMETLRLEYKKAWGIDITSRVRDYVRGTKIDVAESELPRGRHSVDIEISDTGGNRSVRQFSVTVE